MIEKRESPRHRVFKRGLIAFGGGGIDCTIRNLSANGARLDVEHSARLPEQFTLVIEADHFMRRCHAVWIDERRLGVAFD